MNAIHNQFFSTCLIATSVLLGLQGTVHAGDDHKSHEALQITASSHKVSQPLRMGEVIAKLEQAGYRDITEVELDDNHYDVEARNPQGQRVELDVHALTGKILRIQTE